MKLGKWKRSWMKSWAESFLCYSIKEFILPFVVRKKSSRICKGAAKACGRGGEEVRDPRSQVGGAHQSPKR